MSFHALVHAQKTTEIIETSFADSPAPKTDPLIHQRFVFIHLPRTIYKVLKRKRSIFNTHKLHSSLFSSITPRTRGKIPPFGKFAIIFILIYTSQLIVLQVFFPLSPSASSIFHLIFVVRPHVTWPWHVLLVGESAVHKLLHKAHLLLAHRGGTKETINFKFVMIRSVGY